MEETRRRRHPSILCSDDFRRLPRKYRPANRHTHQNDRIRPSLYNCDHRCPLPLFRTEIQRETFKARIRTGHVDEIPHRQYSRGNSVPVHARGSLRLEGVGIRGISRRLNADTGRLLRGDAPHPHHWDQNSRYPISPRINTSRVSFFGLLKSVRFGHFPGNIAVKLSQYFLDFAASRIQNIIVNRAA
jgi:hypothetical protein